MRNNSTQFIVGVILTTTLLASIGCELPSLSQNPHQASTAQHTPPPNTPPAQGILSGTRQLTFAGKRSGEGYYAPDGSALIFQSERDAANPFYQIFTLDLETGDTLRISPGYGKTTCAWLHPDGVRALYSSTHDDPQAIAKQATEIEFRASGQERRYSWDYDEHYEIYESDLGSRQTFNLTNTPGYDAEASYSPNGKSIAFASNRSAYTQEMSPAARELFERDPAYMMEIYIMNADGSDVRQLTNSPGYDGGPFFSADGSKICWRRFTPDGATAEIYTMNTDGSNPQQITTLGAMSWAPYFHPSGQYLIFTTNIHGFANFELYLIAADGSGQPVRVTDTEGFDGLPVFSPDGTKLTWTSTRTSTKTSQLFTAQWNHAAALKALKGAAHPTNISPINTYSQEKTAGLSPAITTNDLQTHIGLLASDAMDGRMTGTEGGKLAAGYVADEFARLGLQPAGDGDSYFQAFEFTSGVSLGNQNKLQLTDANTASSNYKANTDWRPLAYSKLGAIAKAPIVFAGYGIVAPKTEAYDEYDSYVHLDVKDKWVLVFRYMPEDIEAGHRQALNRFSGLRYKAMVARNKGAAGLIVVSGPRAKVRNQLVPLSYDASSASSSMAAISITDKLATDWLNAAGKDIAKLQAQLDTGDAMMGFELPNLTLAGQVDITQEKRIGWNILAQLPAADTSESTTSVIVGAHVDHLGRGGAGSLHSDESDDPTQNIHHGADDNASGVGALLEVAAWLADLKARGKASLKHNVLFAAWSGEELGLLGSNHFADSYPGAPSPPSTENPHAQQNERHEKIVAYLNMDMVGRYREKLVIQGMGSSPVWQALIEKANVPVGLSLTTSQDSYLPTDATSFFVKGVPILSAFTGAHEDYHKPSDTADKINYPDTQRIAQFVGLVTRSLAIDPTLPAYQPMQKPKENEQRAGLRAYLGTIPDYAQGDVTGVKLSGATKGGPAEKAGVRGGDIIIKLADRSIENIYDYTYAIEALKIDEPVEIVVQRNNKELTFTVTPGSRD